MAGGLLTATAPLYDWSPVVVIVPPFSAAVPVIERASRDVVVPTTPASVVLPVIVRLSWPAVVPWTVPSIRTVLAEDAPALVVSMATSADRATLSLMVTALPAVTMSAPSVVVAPGPSSVMLALPLPVIGPVTLIAPAPTGDASVTGSLNVDEPTVIVPPPLVASPIVIELKPSVSFASSVSLRLRSPVPPPMPMVVLAVLGLIVSAPVPPTSAPVPIATLSDSSVIAPLAEVPPMVT